MTLGLASGFPEQTRRSHMAFQTERLSGAVMLPSHTADVEPEPRPAAADRPVESAERRLLTALYYDVVGSTDLLGMLDIEDFRDLMADFQRMAKQAITAFGGVVRVEMGDGGVALFPTGIDARDAATLAIRAGLEIIDACARRDRQQAHANLQIRVGIATSMALVQEMRDADPLQNVTGAALAMATRLQALAEPNTVFVSQQTRNLARRSHVFRFMGERVLKGFPDPEPVWRALSHKREVDRFFAFGRLGSPLVGRIAELRTIADTWHSVVDGRGEVLLIEGEAGIGKSRLVREVRRATRIERSKSLLFQCLPGGSRHTLHPLMHSLFGSVTDSNAPLAAADVADLFGHQGVFDEDIVGVFSFLLGARGGRSMPLDTDPETMRDRAKRAARRALETICRSGPVVIIVEDVQWIDPTSRQLLVEIARVVERHSVLLVVTGRPGSAGWLETRRLRRLQLRPLAGEDARQAISAHWPAGQAADAPELRDAVERVTGGIPLYIEEVCQWLTENTESATGSLTQAASSTSIFENVLDSRLEGLQAGRDLIRAAAVAGSRFTHSLLCELLPGHGPDAVAHALEALGEAGLLTRVRHSSQPVYGFRHTLFQETVYNAMLRRTRKALHLRLFETVSRKRDIAAWISEAALAEHAERANLTENAIELFLEAGKASSARSAMVEARQLLEHALALCSQVVEPDRHDTLQLAILSALGPILTATEGPNSSPARKLYDDGVEIARRRPTAERARWFPIFWGWWFTDKDVDGERAQTVLHDLRDVRDDEVQLQVRHCVWAIDFNLGRHESCISAVEAGLALYSTAHGTDKLALYGGHDAKVCGLLHKGLSCWHAGRAASAVRSVSEGRRWAYRIGHAGSIAHALDQEAILCCYRRDFGSLGSVLTDMRQLADEHRLNSLAVKALVLEGWCEAHSGRVEAGRDMMKRGLATLGELQTPEDYPVYSCLLAELMAQTGEVDEALTMLAAARREAEQNGYRYWLAEILRRSACLLALSGAPESDVLTALWASLDLALEQSAVPILIAAHTVARNLPYGGGLADRYEEAAALARERLEPGEPLLVEDEPAYWKRAG